jgi:hypothetical protein
VFALADLAQPKHGAARITRRVARGRFPTIQTNHGERRSRIETASEKYFGLAIDRTASVG